MLGKTEGTMTDQLQLIPLAKLSLAPENARYGVAYDKDELKALSASIVAAGRLLDPLHVYPDGNGFKVWDGGRRLAALQGLAAVKAAGKGLPEPLRAGVPCLVDPDNAKARLHSAATFVRTEMHPADKFLAYKALFDQGLDEAEVAAVCAVPQPRVRQLLRLRSVALEIIDAFKAGKMALDVVEAFSLTDDHERQRQVLASFGAKTPDAWTVRQALRTGSLDGSAWIAQFVGRAAYEAAGGRFLVDLFSRGDKDCAWLDGDLAQKLADEKLKAVADGLAAEGWGAVVHVQSHVWDWSKGYVQVPEAERDEAAKRACTVFLREDRRGELKRELWWTKAAKGKNATTAAGKAAQADPALYGYGHSGHGDMTMLATRATRAALVRNPAAAYDAALSYLAWEAFRVTSDAGRSGDDQRCGSLENKQVFGRPSVAVAGDQDMDHVRSKWAARLPTARVEFCDYVAGLDPAEKAQLLAVSFAHFLDAYEARFDSRKTAAWAHLGWMARHAGLDMAAEWTPDAAFLKRGTREALTLGLKACGETAKPDAKKGDLAARLAAVAPGKRWLPKLLATFTGDASPPAKPSKAARRAELAAKIGA